MCFCKCFKKEKQMANAIRFLSIDAIEKAKSGHPGMPMGMADVATILWTHFLKFNPSDGQWFDRDRFILSAGHGSMLLYSLLYLSGYKDISLEDIKNFRQLGSKTAGHPEYGHLSGVDMTTGPLGQGISSAVGMAIAEKILQTKYGKELCNHYTYVIAGDGCLMEGISQEAISIAGHLGLNKLIVFWDNNNITIDGNVNRASSEDQILRFKACGWNTIQINGHNHCQIYKAIKKAQKSSKPTLIACKTVIGFGSPNKSGTSKCHGSPLGAEEISLVRKELAWECPAFEIPSHVKKLWQEAGKRSAEAYKKWQSSAKRNKSFYSLIHGDMPKNWDKDLEAFKNKVLQERPTVATRKSSQLCLEQIVKNVPALIGGSADLVASNLTHVDGMKLISKKDFNGNEIAYGIREHAMGAIMNGLALHGGFIPFGGTFFVFSDYLRPSVRLAALMGLKEIYVFTHDSIGVGEDGPTHEPIEHLASYRAMPNINVFRPADTIETAECWQCALQDNKPSMLILSRQNLPTIRQDIKENLSTKGAYIISSADSKKTQDGVLIASGSEVSLAMKAQEELASQGINVAVVSMVCCGLFDKQDSKYKEKVLGSGITIAIEAASGFGWERYVKETSNVISINQFGASGPAGQLYEHFSITVKNIVKTVKQKLKERNK